MLFNGTKFLAPYNLKIFDDYLNKEKSIEKNKQIIESIKASKKFLKKYWLLIYLEKPILLKNNEPIKYLIYNYQNNTYNWIKEDFLEDKEKENAYKILSIIRLKNINSDKFKNPYARAYELEKRKFKDLNIGGKYASN